MTNKGGRPPKWDKVITVAKEILNSENIMLLTDEDLVFLINEKLDNDTISQSTFEKWKSGKISDDKSANKFLRVIKKALIEQKKELFKKFSNDDRAWQRWAWIIERKFSEWNLKNINENKNENNHKGEIKINYNIPNGDKS